MYSRFELNIKFIILFRKMNKILIDKVRNIRKRVDGAHLRSVKIYDDVCPVGVQ